MRTERRASPLSRARHPHPSGRRWALRHRRRLLQAEGRSVRCPHRTAPACALDRAARRLSTPRAPTLRSSAHGAQCTQPICAICAARRPSARTVPADVFCTQRTSRGGAQPVVIHRQEHHSQHRAWPFA
ncbi:hypothetical protein HYPSUDRAFT_505556 [Hypholoma sublateritium FD-334 SS-4]|uniref:Uncharacterized protein n=1 Tax=Hypholoma sublateritium (strain FD-334 SS-4) TaxID=945553 RepID=A0A0D2PLQ9_HYPSF|nr:hypothetical protein HYPSUDRAFT_505556 [Hypholoma sublateritium FD-334 SS-4]